ncbi:hypothetical protein CXB51_029473 [Gossypium anomalum]|uniref:Uncharacterized protein n=1 Tax=Gossypium anomalum TaxID=47600 RepID=A0A8J5Y996_9ROSI|nr:hypothetical protein CXB51_029473 [Gossypium anomalum]
MLAFVTIIITLRRKEIYYYCIGCNLIFLLTSSQCPVPKKIGIILFSKLKKLFPFQFNTEGYLLRLHLPECWVVSKLHMLIDAVPESYNKFFFGDVGREIYDFFWGVCAVETYMKYLSWSYLLTKNTGIIFTLISCSYFCVICPVFRSATQTWDLCFYCLHGYIEASKARLYHSGDDSVALVAQTVILYVFENILKLITSIHAIRTPQSERSSYNIFGHIFSLSKATHRVGMICTVYSFMSLQTPFRLFCIFNLKRILQFSVLHIDNLTSSKIDVLPKFCTDNVSPERNWLGRIRRLEKYIN